MPHTRIHAYPDSMEHVKKYNSQGKINVLQHHFQRKTNGSKSTM
jgi:hypothetical protein